MRGYLPADAERKSTVVDVNADQDALRELTTKKQNLLTELKNYGENDRVCANFNNVILLVDQFSFHINCLNHFPD